jgi:hypothetical protein
VKSTNVPTIALALSGANVPFANNAPPTKKPAVATPPPQTPAPTPAPAPCRRKYRVGLLFDWDAFAGWVACMLTPRMGL